MMRSAVLTSAAVCALMLCNGAGAQGAVPSLADLVRDADQVVTGTVERLATVWEDVDMKKDGPPARLVLTYYEVTPSEVFKGQQRDRLLPRILGGRLDGYAYIHVQGTPMSSGEQAVLFLSESETPRAETGELAHYLHHGAAGKVRVGSEDGKTIVYRTDKGCATGCGQATATEQVSYSEFRQLLLDAVEQERAGARE